MRSEAAAWCQGRHWQVRALFLLWFAYCLVKHWSNPEYRSILAAFNLGIHELGHFVFSPLGEFIGILGGTLLQILAPFIGMLNFYRQSDFFAIALSFGWLSTSIFDVAAYLADARTMNLPLVSPFGWGNPIHDWNYLLTRMGMLKYDTVLAFLLRCVATGTMFICLMGGFWLLLQMGKGNPDKINV